MERKDTDDRGISSAGWFDIYEPVKVLWFGYMEEVMCNGDDLILSIRLSVRPSLCSSLSGRLAVRPSVIYSFLCPSVSLSVRLSVRLSVCRLSVSVRPYLCPSVSLFLSVRLSPVRLSVPMFFAFSLARS